MNFRGAILFLLLALVSIHTLHFFVVAEDAYISFRYAENLAAGRGVVFNPGERVEGYTNFLWLILLSLCRVLGASIPATSQWLGLLLALGTVLLASDLARRLAPGTRWGGLPAALLVAANPGVAAWAGAGMEVPLFSFLAILTADLWVVERDSNGIPWRWPLAACLTGMARPDGVLLFLVALAIWTLFPRESEDRVWRRWVPPLCVFLAPGVPYFLWRWLYYGALLPNTYAAKSGLNSLVIRHGLGYLWEFLAFAGGLALVAGALLAVRLRTPSVTLLLSQSFLFTVYVVLIGGDGYPYVRFLVPVAVLLAPAAEIGFRHAWMGWSRRWSLTARSSAILGGILVIALAGTGSIASFAGHDHGKFRYSAEVNERRWPIGEWLRDNAPRDSLVALNPAGIIPYVSGLATLDQLGLTDTHIARLGKRITNPSLYAHDRHDSRYVLSRRPDILILGQSTVLDIGPTLEDLRRPGPTTFETIAPAVVRDLFAFPGDDETWRDPQFRRLYTPTIVALGKGFFYYFALDRRAAALQDRIASGAATPADHAAMAELLKSKGEVNLALEEAREAESKDPSYATLRSGLEQASLSAARQDELQAAAQEALTRMSADLEREDTAAAERDLLAGLEKVPGDAQLLFNLGVLYERTSRPADALGAYRRAVTSRPDHSDAWTNLGSLYARQGDLKQARECWERAASLDPRGPAMENLRLLSSQGR